MLVIELDGGQHNTPEARGYDASRSAYLEQQGYVVLRFWNHDVLEEMDAVLEKIVIASEERAPGHPHPGPPPQGEGED